MKINKRNLLLVAIIILIVVLFGLGKYSSKGKATLSWNANSEADLAGYNIYYGTASRTGNCPPGGYDKKVSMKKETKYSFNDLDFGKTYYFSVTSYNAAGKESCFSPEIKKRIFSLSF